MSKQYRHKKSSIIVGKDDKDFYYKNHANLNINIPALIVEDSTEWEEIIPLLPETTDFFGNKIEENKLRYQLVEDKHGITHIINALNYRNLQGKIIATFKSYDEGSNFQRIYIALKKVKESITTSSGNPTQYLKNILKAL